MELLWNVAGSWWAKWSMRRQNGVKGGNELNSSGNMLEGKRGKGEQTTYKNMNAIEQKTSIPVKHTQHIENTLSSLDGRLRDFLLEHYEFRYNLLTEMEEFRPLGEKVFRPITGRELNTLCIDAHAEDINCWDKDLWRYINSTKIEEYHPFRLYFEELPAWDGTDRLHDLALRVSDNSLWINSFHRWILGVTAQWMGLTEGVHANSVAPLLVSSEQGKLKSTFCKSLLPNTLQEYYADSIDLSSQGQMELKMATFGLMNLDEFDRIPAHKMPLLKNLMQMTTLNLRKAHQKQFRVLPRIASFIGTSNKKELLSDPTGSRRFICVEVGKRIDCGGINHEQIYAQLKAELTRGERYWFTPAEERQIQASNAAFYSQSPAEEVFRCYFRAVGKEEECEVWSLADIMKELKLQNSVAMRGVSPASFGQALTAAGVEKIHTKYGNRYRVVALEKEKDV